MSTTKTQKQEEAKAVEMSKVKMAFTKADGTTRDKEIELLSEDPDFASMKAKAIKAFRNRKPGIAPYDSLESWLDREWNPGHRSEFDYLKLRTSFQTDGIIKPILVWVKKRDKSGKIKDALVIQGYLRSDGTLDIIKNGTPEQVEAFKAIHPDGIPAEFIEEDYFTEDMAYTLAEDHDTVGRSKAAVIQDIYNYFQRDSKRTEADVACKFWAELGEVFSGIKPEWDKDLEAIRDPDKAKGYMRERRRGVVQPIHYMARNLPPQVFEAYMNGVKGITDGPVIKAGQVGKLNTANEDGTQFNPSSAFKTEFAQFIKDNKSGKPAARAKAQSEMKKDYKSAGSIFYQYILTIEALNLPFEAREYDIALKTLEDDGTLTVLPQMKKVVEEHASTMLPKSSK